MDPAFYDAFLSAEASGLKKQAKTAIEAFVVSFLSSEEKHSWTTQNIEHLTRGDYWHVRHELYVDVVFPSLYADFKDGGEWALKWLAKTQQNLLQSKEQRQLILAYILRQIDRHTRSWPDDIFFEDRSATSDECDTLLRRATFANSITSTGAEDDRIFWFIEQVQTYQRRLQTND